MTGRSPACTCRPQSKSNSPATLDASVRLSGPVDHALGLDESYPRPASWLDGDLSAITPMMRWSRGRPLRPRCEALPAPLLPRPAIPVNTYHQLSRRRGCNAPPPAPPPITPPMRRHRGPIEASLVVENIIPGIVTLMTPRRHGEWMMGSWAPLWPRAWRRVDAEDAGVR